MEHAFPYCQHASFFTGICYMIFRKGHAGTLGAGTLLSLVIGMIVADAAVTALVLLPCISEMMHHTKSSSCRIVSDLG